MIAKASKLDENWSNVSSRKLRSDNDTKNTCFYLYYLDIFMDETVVITLNKNAKQGSKPLSSLRNYQCSSIVSGNNQLFTENTLYKVIDKDERGIHSLEFDESTDVPTVVNSDEKKIITADQSCRIQQHIILHKINKLLLYYYGCMIDYHVRRQKNNTLSKLTLDTFIDFDENGLMKLKVKQESKDDYEEICETMNIIFSHFLENRKGITQRLIIGDRLTFGKKPPTEECVYMSRYTFSQIFNRVRYMKEDIDVIVSS